MDKQKQELTRLLIETRNVTRVLPELVAELSFVANDGQIRHLVEFEVRYARSESGDDDRLYYLARHASDSFLERLVRYPQGQLFVQGSVLVGIANRSDVPNTMRLIYKRRFMEIEPYLRKDCVYV